MSKITALKTNRRTNKQVSMFLDGKFTVSLDTEIAVKEGLKIGQELSDDQSKGADEKCRFGPLFEYSLPFSQLSAPQRGGDEGTPSPSWI